MSKISPAMRSLLDAASSVAPVVYADGSVWDRGTLVSGRQVATARALEARGLVFLHWNGGDRVWVKAKEVSE